MAVTTTPSASILGIESETPSDSIDLLDAQDQFVATWGRMGASWGIARTMAEIHALLYIVGRPLNTDQIMDRLDVSRGTVSMTLRSLLDWGIVFRAHLRGDRKEYFTAEQDVWKLFRTVLAQRKQREIDPLLESLETCLNMTQSKNDRNQDSQSSCIADHNARIENLLSFVRTVDSISRRLVSPGGSGLEMAIKLLSRLS